MEAPSIRKRQTLSPLRHRDFRLYWTGSLLSSVGSQFTQVAMAWQIYELTDSPLQIGLIGLARAAPQMVVLLFGGLLADAMNRRKLVGSGIGDTISAVLRATINQLSTPDELRGRMASINSIFTNSGPQLGQFQIGALAAAVGAEIATMTGALTILLIVIVLAAGFPHVRGYRISQTGS